ncbi:MAG: protein kinase, partial [Acidobacteria bacterium]|nr:protein kinase [Acidobacteriota bacterium]
APERRAAFLAEACAGHDSLRREVEALISSHEQTGHFIDAPAFQAAAEMLAGGREFKPGATLSHYEIHSVLGEGGMGRVYLAEDRKLKRKVALKVLSAAGSGDGEARRRLLREAQAAAALDHPNICAIYEVDEASDPCYIAMQYVEGETLEARMENGRLALDDSLNIAAQIADALCEAHARGIIHRDVKPSNVMLTARGQVKVLDFGLAKTASAAPDGPGEAVTMSLLTAPGMVLGTVPYMSPEQLRGETVDARTDIFSFGAVLYELLTCRRAFARASAAETIGAILHERPPELSSVDRGIPKALEDVVGKCLAKDAGERYQTMEQVARDLNAARSGELVAVNTVAARTGQAEVDSASHRETAFTDTGRARPTSSIEYLVSEVKHHRRSALLAMAGVIIAVAALGYYFYFARGSEAIDSVAVLPFVNASNDANTEYLSDGLSDSIINSLSQVPNLKRVIPFSSVSRYKGKQIDPQTVGRELNVGAVLTGRLTLRGDEVLVSTELIDVKNNKRLSGGQYSHKLADVSKLQSEIAQGISEKLRLKLTSEQHERLTRPETENAEAYQLYLQGRYFLAKNTDEATLKSGEYFKQAIEKDPNFALAYVELARYYAIMANFGNMQPNEAWPQAEAAVVKALAIDDRLAEAHHQLGVVKMWYDWDWPGAEREFRRAIELEPEIVRRGTLYVRLLEVLGRFDEAIAERNKADEISPVLRLPDVAGILRSARRYDEAIEENRKQLEREPNRRGNYHLAIGMAYAHQGKYEEALAEVREARPVVTEPRQLAQIGYVYAAAGKRDEAVKILEEVKALTGERHNLSPSIAAIYAVLGNKDEALAWLKRACDEHHGGVVGLKIDQRFDTLRSDQRFVDLLRRVKLAP